MAANTQTSRIMTRAILYLCCLQFVILSWDFNPEPDVIGYRIYYGQLNHLTNVLDVGFTNRVVLPRTTNQMFYTLAAYNLSGLESEHPQ